jgi:hypothetical protein
MFRCDAPNASPTLVSTHGSWKMKPDAARAFRLIARLERTFRGRRQTRGPRTPRLVMAAAGAKALAPTSTR